MSGNTVLESVWTLCWFLFRPKRPPPSLSEFLEPETDGTINRQIIQGHNRWAEKNVWLYSLVYVYSKIVMNGNVIDMLQQKSGKYRWMFLLNWCLESGVGVGGKCACLLVYLCLCVCSWTNAYKWWLGDGKWMTEHFGVWLSVFLSVWCFEVTSSFVSFL